MAMSRTKAPRLIAVVEDDPAVRHSLAFDLEAQGYSVCAFERATEALVSAVIPTADCLVIDYALPDLDGAALLLALRRRGLACPAIIIASTPSTRCRREAARAKAPLLEKPLMGGVLDTQIRTSLCPG